MTLDSEGIMAAAPARHGAITPRSGSPVRAQSPAPQQDRGRLEVRHDADGPSLRNTLHSNRSSGMTRTGDLDAEAVNHALVREMARQQRESTPGGSPHRKRQRINGDR